MCISQRAHRNPKTRISLKPGTFSNTRFSCLLGGGTKKKGKEFSCKKLFQRCICLSFARSSWCLGFFGFKTLHYQRNVSTSIRPRNETPEVRFNLTSADAALFILWNAPAAGRRQRVLSTYNTFNIAARVLSTCQDCKWHVAYWKRAIKAKLLHNKCHFWEPLVYH